MPVARVSLNAGPSSGQRRPLIVRGIGILDAGQNLYDLKITIPEGSFAESVDKELISVMAGGFPYPEVGDARGIELNVVDAQSYLGMMLAQDLLDVGS